VKFTLITLVFSALCLMGYVDDSVLLTLHETQLTHQSNSPNLVNLLEKEDMSVENHFPVTKYIDIKLCKEVI
jgi:hypothetical protein